MSYPPYFYGIYLFSVSFVLYKAYQLFSRNPLHELDGPPLTRILGGHMSLVLDPGRSPLAHERFVKEYGRNVRIQGIHPWDVRLLPMDPVSVAHVLKNSTVYEKPWQSRRLITGLIGCGLLAAEGQMHKRQRRVVTPAFSIQNMRALVPLVFCKGEELRDKWMEMIEAQNKAQKEDVNGTSMVLDVSHWISRATFDVIGLAGFDYQFNAIQNESNELFCAYKDMFEVAISQGQSIKSIASIYLPIISRILPDKQFLAVRQGQETIQRVASQLVQEKKRKILKGEQTGKSYEGKDLLTLLLKSNVATDLPEEQRISDDDILHNINTFMFAGSDTTSLALTWTLVLLAKFPDWQIRLRNELLSIRPSTPHATLCADEVESLYTVLSALPLLHNVCRESLRLIPPVHSSLRVATRDDVVPVSAPFTSKDGILRDSILVPNGTFVHIPVEAMNLDKEIWGPDAWQFNPDRWDSLPDAAAALPGLFSNTLTFSAGPRSCIGQRFSMIEMKTFLYILLTDFAFSESGEKVVKANVVLTRPYISGRFKDGSQCPLVVRPYVAA
ncbi:cytochrome P450 monooxygenase 43 [Heterobasidion irregulare TC 32-1]|uniref:Cytochrome P450 monooxygenase 43 n=1 Tax=Heterobasidion irregulare (strain TC 32-1) TaxID=747525 RepID=W4K5V0_HETIT|nr:cytochrome P450 monooxygenase 43 [Heterobasidion irregulare TC 32-1]ETW80421.1 cytochrome P450 monooxygenase 43 [Heterobasidion irregulare TC 32-1]